MIFVYENLKKIDVKTWNFPGGEVGVKITSPIKKDSKFIIVLNGIPTSDEIFIVLNIADALKRIGVKKNDVGLLVPYLPYARQDRVCHQGESFALSVFLNVLSTGYFSLITTVDLHSDVSMKMLDDKFDDVDHILQYEAANSLPDFDVLIAPDKGAESKIVLYSSVVAGKSNVVCLRKTRTKSGVLYDDYAYDTIKGSVCVVDDLCDGAATFISLGKMLKQTQPNITSLNLYVTHGLFSNNENFTKLKELFDEIFVYNLMNISVEDSVVGVE